MTLIEAERPRLSWEILHEMMAGATWSEAWRETGSWAFRVLERHLGSDWPATVMSKSPTGGAPQLAWAVGHVVAYAEVLELALRLELLRGANGHAKLRRALRTDPRPPLLLHCEMQLEVAALALKSGITPTLEPPSPRGRPADVAIPVGDQQLIVEARAILTSDDWRDDNDWTDQLFERIRRIEAKHGVRCEGEVSTFLDENDTQGLLRELETRARLVAARLAPPPLRIPGVAIDVVRDVQAPARGLRGPEMSGDSWARIGPRIREKAEAAVESGANWLRLDARDGLWQFTEWATRPLGEKLEAFDAAVRGLCRGLDGVVVSCGAVRAEGQLDDEDVVLRPGLVALRRRLPFVRARETLVITADAASLQEARLWIQFYSEEPSWLDWALDRSGLPPVGAILARKSNREDPRDAGHRYGDLPIMVAGPGRRLRG